MNKSYGKFFFHSDLPSLKFHENSFIIFRSAKDSSNKTLQQTIHEQSLIANKSMATALEDIRVEHEDSLRGMEGKIKESYEKKISDLDAKFRRQKELTEQKRNEASQAKALQAQANTQLARAEKDVSSRIFDYE